MRYWAQLNLITYFHLESVRLKVEWRCCPLNLPSHDIWLRGDEENSCQLSLLQEEKILTCLVFLVAHASSHGCSVAVLLLACASLELAVVVIPAVFGSAVAAPGLDKISFVFRTFICACGWNGSVGSSLLLETAGWAKLQECPHCGLWSPVSYFWFLLADNPHNHTTCVKFCKILCVYYCVF